MLTRSQDCVSHHGLVLHETLTSESTKSTRSCFGADIEVAGVGSFLDSCLPVGIAGKSMHNNWQHFWQAEREYIHCDECYMISPMGEPFWRNCKVPGCARYCQSLVFFHIESSASGPGFVEVLKPQLYFAAKRQRRFAHVEIVSGSSHRRGDATDAVFCSLSGLRSECKTAKGMQIKKNRYRYIFSTFVPS